MVNYNESIIYKLCCKDTEIKDEYVGSTTNFKLRKNGHKSCCMNVESKNHSLLVYQCIRQNGGFMNWDMVEVEKYSATDKKDLHKRERYWIELLKTTLNKTVPTRTQKEYIEENKSRTQKVCKEYREKHKDTLKKQKKEWAEANKESIAEKSKEYRQKNKDQLKIKKLEYRKTNVDKKHDYDKAYREKNIEMLKIKKHDYYAKNKEKIAERDKITFICECGKELQKADITRHRKTQSHIRKLSDPEKRVDVFNNDDQKE